MERSPTTSRSLDFGSPDKHRIGGYAYNFIILNRAVENQWGCPYSIAILKRKNLLSVTPRRFALKSFILALNDSAAALDERLL